MSSDGNIEMLTSARILYIEFGEGSPNDKDLSAFQESFAKMLVAASETLSE